MPKWVTFQSFVVYLPGFSSKPSLNKQANVIEEKKIEITIGIHLELLSISRLAFVLSV